MFEHEVMCPSKASGYKKSAKSLLLIHLEKASVTFTTPISSASILRDTSAHTFSSFFYFMGWRETRDTGWCTTSLHESRIYCFALGLNSTHLVRARQAQRKRAQSFLCQNFHKAHNFKCPPTFRASNICLNKGGQIDWRCSRGEPQSSK